MESADDNAARADPPASAAGRLPTTLSDLLTRLSDGLKTLYGERYKGLVLYGSYARGEADEGSDVDLLVLLDGELDQTRELLRAGDVSWPLSLEAGYTISLLPVGTVAYHHSKEPFLWNARDEGILLP